MTRHDAAMALLVADHRMTSARADRAGALRDARAAGLTVRTIARILHVSTATVIRWTKEGAHA